MANALYKDEAWLRHEYIDLGKSTPLIGKECGVSGHTIYWWMKKLGIPRRTTGFFGNETTRNVKDRLDSEEWLNHQYVDLERGAVEIGNELGVDCGTVLNRLRRYNIEIRDTKTASVLAVIPKDIRDKLNDRDWLHEQYIIKERSINKISKEYKINSTSIRGALQRFGIRIRSRGETRHLNEISRVSRKKLENAEWMKNAYVTEKRDSYDIGCELGISGSTVTSWLRKHGIQVRSLGETHTGVLHPLWNNGSSYFPYCTKFNKKFKKRILEKFNNTCYLCPSNKKLCTHHIDYNKNSICKGRDWAFVPLCPKHHSRSNFERWFWFNLLINYWAMNEEINFNSVVIYSDRI